jgi:hypothetical protein
MTVQQKQEQPKKPAPSKTSASPENARKPSQQSGAELSDDVLDRVAGGEPPDPCRH